eukprot:NODE_4745_length_769_cov_2.901389_g3953_i0.p2 GENE.NODE_4745_length_769_cov_2.901389_g3953_i0~~NODE_4745_length_769_cov_2.901389_g3953_i0.p2  ORF type:complete len:57 (-),score=1.53 NODE_4745_length_769_cov_2.901389_g3953_i0:356-526(-)
MAQKVPKEAPFLVIFDQKSGFLGHFFDEVEKFGRKATEKSGRAFLGPTCNQISREA